MAVGTSIKHTDGATFNSGVSPHVQCRIRAIRRLTGRASSYGCSRLFVYSSRSTVQRATSRELVASTRRERESPTPG